MLALGVGMAMRHGGSYPNRRPGHLVVKDQDWVTPIGSKIPQKFKIMLSFTTQPTNALCRVKHFPIIFFHLWNC